VEVAVGLALQLLSSGRTGNMQLPLEVLLIDLFSDLLLIGCKDLEAMGET